MYTVLALLVWTATAIRWDIPARVDDPDALPSVEALLVSPLKPYKSLSDLAITLNKQRETSVGDEIKEIEAAYNSGITFITSFLLAALVLISDYISFARAT